MDYKIPDDFVIGIDMVDNAHGQLLDLIAQAEVIIQEDDPCRDKANIKTARYVLNRLLDYTVSHFAEEELLMEMFQVPERDAHKKAHRLLERKLVELYHRFETEGLNSLPDLVQLLKAWWANHILSMDKKDLHDLHFHEDFEAQDKELYVPAYKAH